ncbi:MAG: prepilin-type N-terminal cleavage/methylation domain-containing protein [bacterium]|nr:prepilin-type N-terminal cleavage/methylation domain-containing protein [bacterium]
MKNYPSKSTRVKNGFTIVETLIAITVLMIAVAGPLVVASKGLTSALNSKDQMIASFLAQESMEVIKNKKNINITANNSWLLGMETCSSSPRCDASALDVTTKINTECFNERPILNNDNISGCEIYFDESQGGYVNNGGGVRTKFYRYFYLADVLSQGVPVENEKTVHVFVEWPEGKIPYQVELVSQMFNAPR